MAISIIYNYRHVVELYPNGMPLAGEQALLLEGQDAIDETAFKQHSFQKLCPEIERVFAVLSVLYNPGVKEFTTKTEFRRLLADVDATEVRCPVDTRGKPSIGKRFMCFNLFEFVAIMDAALNALSCFLSATRYEVDARCDAAGGY